MADFRKLACPVCQGAGKVSCVTAGRLPAEPAARRVRISDAVWVARLPALLAKGQGSGDGRPQSFRTMIPAGHPS